MYLQRHMLITLGMLCILLMIRSFVQKHSEETFVDENILDSLSVPAKFYDNLEAIPNMYFTEMKEIDFNTIFDKHIVSIPGIDEYIQVPKDMVSQNNAKYILQATEKHVLTILNDVEQSGHPFTILASKLKSMYIGKDGKTATIQILIHRPTKAYGMLGTYYVHITKNDNKFALTKVQIEGFVFEDKLYGNVVPSNLPQSISSYTDMVEHTILKSKEWENKELCDYYQNIDKHRGINYASLGLNTSCDAKSSSSSS